MSVLGKVLIVFNLLAAGAFAYLTLENWKLRQEFGFREIANHVSLYGEPVEAPAEKVDVGEKRVPFVVTVNKKVLESIPQETLDKLVTKGDEEYGGEVVANQTDEVNRLLKKVQANIAAKAGEFNNQGKYVWTKTYLLNLARSGAERDGVNALYDLATPARAGSARRDLPLAARTSSQTAALKALVEIADLGDPQAITPADIQAKRIAAARLAVKNFVKGEAAHGVVDADAKLRLRDTTIENAFRPGAGQDAAAAMVAEATADPAGFKFLGELATNPLNTREKINEAKASILGYATSKVIAGTTKEAAALKDIVECIAPSAGFNLLATIDTAGTALLEQKFEEASMPAATQTKATGNPQAEKARRIAHVLYHIDAHRHSSTKPEDVSARKAWHTRVVSIIGLQEYVRAAEAQASEYAEAGQRLLAVISEEEASFRAEYQLLVQRCQALHSQWLSLENQLTQQKAVQTANEALLTERQTEYDALVVTLAEAQVKAKAAQDNLKKIQDQRFQILKDLRDAQQALFRLEGELRRLELKDDKKGTN